MDEEKVKGTIEKALRLNIDPAVYGTIAEIGAGQEVARNFFMAGGAAGTIAKTMSAYDMQFSDAIYGTEDKKRYVSKSRLNRMLDREYNLVLERLEASRPAETKFFAFADTVLAKGYKSNRPCHGWMGVIFQSQPKQEPCRIILHVNMKDHTNTQQQVALGMLGINLIFGAFYLCHDPKKLIESLLDSLTTERIEIDMVKFEGPEFTDVDNRLMALHLVKSGLTRSVFFTPDKEPAQAFDLFYKKNIMVLRGSYRPFTRIHLDILECAKKTYLQEKGQDENFMFLTEISMSHLMKFGDLDPTDFLGRVETLCRMGLTVQISDFARFYELKFHLRKYTQGDVHIALGIKNLKEIFNEENYPDLPGGLLEGLGILFSGSTNLYVYPKTIKAGELVTADEMAVSRELKYLYKHFLFTEKIISLQGFNEALLPTRSKNIREDMALGDGDWTALIPQPVYEEIKRKGLFGYSSKK